MRSVVDDVHPTFCRPTGVAGAASPCSRLAVHGAGCERARLGGLAQWFFVGLAIKIRNVFLCVNTKCILDVERAQKSPHAAGLIRERVDYQSVGGCGQASSTDPSC